MKLEFVITDGDLKKLVLEKLADIIPGASGLRSTDLQFQVRSKQNYRVKEWETGEMRVVISKEVSV